LSELREEFRLLENTLRSVYAIAIDETSRNRINQEEVLRLRDEVRKVRFQRNKQERLKDLVDVMSANLHGQMLEATRDAALDVLARLQSYSSNVGLKLDVVLQRMRKDQLRRQARIAAQGQFVPDDSHPLHLMALDSQDEMRSYADKISILPSGGRRPGGPMKIWSSSVTG
jgi:hypothetical protein